MSKFKLSEIQATHILDILRRLTALEKESSKTKKELKETIKDLTAMLSRAKQNQILIENG